MIEFIMLLHSIGTQTAAVAVVVCYLLLLLLLPMMKISSCCCYTVKSSSFKQCSHHLLHVFRTLVCLCYFYCYIYWISMLCHEQIQFDFDCFDHTRLLTEIFTYLWILMVLFFFAIRCCPFCSNCKIKTFCTRTDIFLDTLAHTLTHTGANT